jgi:Asp-tRNA(Asn)/Glu-tRNA(Gln) amidotransferase A subunit family amidase
MLSPTLAGPPPRLGELVASEQTLHGAEAKAASWVSFPLVTANLTGRPAMSVPLHRYAGGLPIGAHFMGPFGGEATLFRLAGQLEESRPWVDLWPAVSAPTHHQSGAYHRGGRRVLPRRPGQGVGRGARRASRCLGVLHRPRR